VKILFIGDIVGSPGRNAVKILLPKLREQHALDFVIANGENSAGGSGITPKLAEEIFSYGVDAITSGDHLWDQKEVMELLANEKRFLRPLNYPAAVPGRGSGVFEVKRWGETPGEPSGKNKIPAREDARPTKLSIAVLNLQGRTFMQPPLENPFLIAAEEVKRLRAQTKIIFVDFHAEATSEKIAFARFLDGQASAVVGTHTHVQTADEQIFPGGTAYLTDAGFTGPHDGVLGRETGPVIKKFLTGMPQRFEVARNDVKLHGAVIEIDDATGNAVKIQRVSEAI
jgi:calcineurin-like phosphoesterase